MKRKKPNNFINYVSFFIFFIIFIYFTIAFSYTFEGFDLFKTFSIPTCDEFFSSGTTWLIIILIISFVSLFIYADKKQKEKIEYIKNNFPVVHGKVVDILIYIRYGKKNNQYYLYPIIQNLDNNKYYVFFNGYGIKKWSSSVTHSVFSSLKYNLYVNGKDINIGDDVRFYITKEIDTFKKINETLIFKNIKYTYYGKVFDKKVPVNMLSNRYLLNESREDFLEMINDMIIFDGFIDFTPETDCFSQ